MPQDRNSVSPSPVEPHLYPSQRVDVGSLPKHRDAKSLLHPSMSATRREATTTAMTTNSDFMHKNPSHVDIIGRLKAKVLALNEELEHLRHVDVLNHQLQLEVGRLSMENQTLREAVGILTRRAKAEEDRRVAEATLLCELERKTGAAVHSERVRKLKEGSSLKTDFSSHSRPQSLTRQRPHTPSVGLQHPRVGAMPIRMMTPVRSISPQCTRTNCISSIKETSLKTLLPSTLTSHSYQPIRRAQSARRTLEVQMPNSPLSKCNDGLLASTVNTFNKRRESSSTRSQSPLPVALTDTTALPMSGAIRAFKVPAYNLSPKVALQANTKWENDRCSYSPHDRQGLSLSPLISDKEGSSRSSEANTFSISLSRQALLPLPESHVDNIPRRAIPSRQLVAPSRDEDNDDVPITRADEVPEKIKVIENGLPSCGTDNASMQFVEISAITDAHQNYSSPSPHRTSRISGVSSAGNSPQEYGVHYVQENSSSVITSRNEGITKENASGKNIDGLGAMMGLPPKHPHLPLSSQPKPDRYDPNNSYTSSYYNDDEDMDEFVVFL